MSAVRNILDFWFSPAVEACWFDSTAELDDTIRKRFENDWIAASKGTYEHWSERPEGVLALCILLDQFPLNMYRHSARRYSTEQQAVGYARTAIARGWHAQMKDTRQRLFLCLPFMHSEHLADQELSVALCAELDSPETHQFAQHHRDIIRRFGRFPHRNEALGRCSTAAEEAWLRSPQAFKA